MDKNELKREVFKVKKSKLLSQADYMYKNKIPFTMKHSGSVMEIESDLFNSKSLDRKFNGKELNFIKKVKKHVINENVSMNFLGTRYKSKDIKYIEVSKKLKSGDVYEDVYCLDLVSAYFQMALMLGVISPDIYKEGIGIDKVTRLASLGSLARRTEVREYDGKEYRLLETIESTATENCWFAICYKVGELMLKASKSLGDEFIFYWVDGIFFKNTPENIKKVSDVFAESGFESKQENVGKIEVMENELLVYSQNCLSSRRFAYSVGRTRKKVMSPTEIKRLLKYANTVLYSPNHKSNKVEK